MNNLQELFWFFWTWGTFSFPKLPGNLISKTSSGSRNSNLYSFSRYLLGTFYGTTHFQLLSGLYIGRQKEPYNPIFISLTFFVSSTAFICIFVKKIRERYKDNKLLLQINIQIQTPPPPQFQYNNVKNNNPILNGLEMTLTVGIVFSTSLLLLVHFLAGQDEIDNYWIKSNYLELATSIIYKVIIPIVYLVKRKDVRNFMWTRIFN